MNVLWFTDLGKLVFKNWSLCVSKRQTGKSVKIFSSWKLSYQENQERKILSKSDEAEVFNFFVYSWTILLKLAWNYFILEAPR